MSYLARLAKPQGLCSVEKQLPYRTHWGVDWHIRVVVCRGQTFCLLVFYIGNEILSNCFFSQASIDAYSKQDDSWFYRHQCGFWNDTCHIDGPSWTQQVVLAIAVAIIYGRSSVIWAGMMREQCWIKHHCDRK